MDAAAIQALSNFGYGKAAEYLGFDHDQFRPTGPNDPLSDTNSAGTVRARFDASPSFDASKPLGYGKAVWFGLYDPTDVAVGDYLRSQDDPAATYFVASQQSLVQPQVVQCNVVLTFLRAHAASPADDAPRGVHAAYQDNPNNRGHETVAANWPASMLAGTKGEKNALTLPESTRDPWSIILVPAIPGVHLRTNDMAVDGYGRHFKISQTELTDLGYRLTAELVEP